MAFEGSTGGDGGGDPICARTSIATLVTTGFAKAFRTISTATCVTRAGSR
jgi:hypothetical protein